MLISRFCVNIGRATWNSCPWICHAMGGNSTDTFKVINMGPPMKRTVTSSTTKGTISRWWFQIFFIFTPTWEGFPIWQIFSIGLVQPPTRFEKRQIGRVIHGSLCDGEVVKPVVGCKNYWPKNWKKEWAIERSFKLILGGGFKYVLYVQTPIWGNDPIWLLFLRWVETTNYSYPRSVLYHTFPPKFEFPRPFLPPGSSLVSWHKVVISPMAMDEVERQLSIWCL